MLSTSSMVWTAVDMPSAWAAQARDCQAAPRPARYSAGFRFDDARRCLFLGADQPRLHGGVRVRAARRAILGRGRDDGAAHAERADHDFIAAAFGSRVVGYEHAEFALVAARALRSGWSLSAGVALRAGHALRPAFALRSRRSGWAGLALGARDALRSRRACRPCGTRRPGVALRTHVALSA